MTRTVVGAAATGPQSLRMLDTLMKAGFGEDALALIMPVSSNSFSDSNDNERAWLRDAGSRADSTRRRVKSLRESGVLLLPGAECIGAGPLLDGLRTASKERESGLTTALTALGIPSKTSTAYERHVKEGRPLVVVRVETHEALEQVRHILAGAGALTVAETSGGAAVWRTLQTWWAEHARRDDGRARSLVTNPTALLRLIKDAAGKWSDDRAPRLGASLAYYTVFSLGPLLFIAISVAGLVFGAEATQGALIQQFQRLLGDESAQAIQTMMQTAARTSSGVVGTVIAAGTLLLGASGVFGQLQDALNTVWGIAPKSDRGLIGLIKDRFISLLAVLGTGFLLLVSLVLTAGVAAVGDMLREFLPGQALVLQVVNLLVTFGLITLLFAMMFKLLPDATIAWSDVWIGGGVTAVLFMVGQFAIGLYLGKSNFSSTYGAAASLIIILAWVYYSAQILLFGAEFTAVYASRYGSRIVPTKGASAVGEPARSQQMRQGA